MKSKTLLLILACVLGLCFTSCGDDDVIIDYVPIIFRVNIYDQQGNDLLDPSNPQNILDKGILMEYKGNDFSIADKYGDQIQPTPSRYYLPMFYGLSLAADKDQQGNLMYYTLKFGEFDASEKAEYSCVLKITDLDLSYELTCKLNKPGKPQFFLNGDHLKKQMVYKIVLTPEELEK